jgi:hypothetical protein
MKKVYVLQVQGWGDDEDAFYNTGVFDNIDSLENAKQNLVREAYDDGLTDVVLNVEEFEINA